MMCNVTTVDEFNDLVSENDYVLIKFFATWCGPCKKLQQNIEIVEKEFPDVVVVGIDVDDADDAMDLYFSNEDDYNIFMTEKATKLGLTFEEFVSNRENYKYIFVAHFQKQTN